MGMLWGSLGFLKRFLILSFGEFLVCTIHQDIVGTLCTQQKDRLLDHFFCHQQCETGACGLHMSSWVRKETDSNYLLSSTCDL